MGRNMELKVAWYMDLCLKQNVIIFFIPCECVVQALGCHANQSQLPRFLDRATTHVIPNKNRKMYLIVSSEATGVCGDTTTSHGGAVTHIPDTSD